MVLRSLLCLVALLAGVGPEEHIWLGADGKPVPFRTAGQLIEFLRSSQVVSRSEISEGINRSQKVLLEKDGIRMHAIFRVVSTTKIREMKYSGRRLELRDDYLLECAAYRTALLLGLDNVPPVIERTLDGVPGSLQVWIEKARTSRRKAEEQPGDLGEQKRLFEQYEAMWVFDNLIFNDDRNKGNVLIGADGKLWMIDHTQSFRTFEELPYPSLVSRCDRSLFERLKNLQADEIRQALAPYLQPKELEALLVRRDLLVEHIEDLIAEYGEPNVLY